ncbi:hypothetical protein BIV23_40905 [Streptomyces monashensis]|uniref:Uncharacterized protein n=1 Tax=Streptomyces monashensis TaxID=1678012 RepID=A0A1S2P9H6_9ACTN|nr:hypothetical protein BIV23_40905 [Streptomyces monashensis]
MVGSVTRERYDELVKLGRDWVTTRSGAQWRIGDAATEIEPMRSYGVRILQGWTTCSLSARPADVSHTIQKILAIPYPGERFEAVTDLVGVMSSR